MNKTEILNVLSGLQIPKDKFWVSGGAALVLHDVKNETGDIDLGCTTRDYDVYFKSNHCKMSMGSRICSIMENVEMIENWFAESLVDISGFRVASLESIRKQKQQLGRAKDQKDMKLIDDYLKRAHQS